MTGRQRIWLVVNDASGSNDEQARSELQRWCGEAGFAVERTIEFPAEALPDGPALDRAGIGTVAVFAGDGTVNALLGGLSGWGGAVLVLPGGTMNLLYRRLHGNREMASALHLAAAGKAKRVRPRVIATGGEAAFVDLLAGPGTRWYEVREAMREADVLGIADTTARALGETLGTPGIICREPSLGRAEGYPLVMLTPTDQGIAVCGFYAETPAEFLKGGWAVLRHRFRDGPHDDLGLVEQVALASTEGEPFGLLVDGEPAESAEAQVFRLVPCGVDLLATRGDGF